jgi:hypothetical protein
MRDLHGDSRLAANRVAGGADRVECQLNGVFHDGHATADGVLHELELLNDEDIDFASGALAFLVGSAQHVLAPLASFVHDPVLGDQRICPIARNLNDPGALILGFAYDSFAFLDHSLGLLDLVGHSHPELIDESQELLFFNHYPAAERHAFADTDQLLEPIDQVENIGGSVLLSLWCAALRHIPSPETCVMPYFPS